MGGAAGVGAHLEDHDAGDGAVLGALGAYLVLQGGVHLPGPHLRYSNILVNYAWRHSAITLKTQICMPQHLHDSESEPKAPEGPQIMPYKRFPSDGRSWPDADAISFWLDGRYGSYRHMRH